MAKIDLAMVAVDVAECLSRYHGIDLDEDDIRPYTDQIVALHEAQED